MAMTCSLYTQKPPTGKGRGFYLNKIKRSAYDQYSIRENEFAEGRESEGVTHK